MEYTEKESYAQQSLLKKYPINHIFFENWSVWKTGGFYSVSYFDVMLLFIFE